MDFDYLRKNLILIAVGLLSSLLAVAMNGMGWLNFAYDWSNLLIEPVSFWSGEAVSNTKGFFDMISEIGDLKADNDALTIENALLLSENSKISELESQNKLLKDQLKIEELSDLTLKQARILGVDSRKSSGYVIIDLGSDDLVEKDDVVILGNILVGKVRDVFSSTSRVALISNKSSNIVGIDKQTRAKGLIHGSLDGVVMEDILENEELNVGDQVVSWEDETPPGLLIGLVEEVEDNPTSSTKKATLDLIIQLEDLDYVFVVLDY